MLGCSPEEMIGRPVTDFMFEEDASGPSEEMENRARGCLRITSGASAGRNGASRCGRTLRPTPILNEAAHSKGSFAMFTDITARKRAKRKCQPAQPGARIGVAARTSKLQAANRELETFTYSVSHDLRQPLRTIDGFLGLLKKRQSETLDDERPALHGDDLRRGSAHGEADRRPALVLAQRTLRDEQGAGGPRRTGARGGART